MTSSRQPKEVKADEMTEGANTSQKRSRPGDGEEAESQAASGPQSHPRATIDKRARVDGQSDGQQQQQPAPAPVAVKVIGHSA